MLNSEGFNLWANNYDKTVFEYSEKYPFDGYYDVLTEVYNRIKTKANAIILDVGIGTGLLSEKLYLEGSKIVGLDFSQEMLDIASSKIPLGEFHLYDFNNNFPKKLLDVKFDYIISTYAIHHVDDDRKIELFNEMLNLLNPKGVIIVADISFNNEKDMEKCKESSKEDWDSNELYFEMGSFSKKLKSANIKYNYIKISSCAGILQIYK